MFTLKQLATASQDCYIKFWDIQTGNITRSINTYSKCYDMHVSLTETRIASGHKDGGVKIWDGRSKDQIIRFEDAHADPVSCVRFTQNENMLVTMSKDDTLKVWDLKMQRLLHSFEHELLKVGTTQNKFCLSPNNQFAVIGTKEGALIYYDLK